MEQKFTGLIAPNSKTVIEFVDDSVIDTDNSITKEAFLRVSPDCNYIVTGDFKIDVKGADVILLNSSSFATLSMEKVTNLINDVSEKLKDDGVMILALENVSYFENVMAILSGQPLTVKATLTFEELQAAIEQSNMSVTENFQIAKKTIVKRAILELAKAPLNLTHYIYCTVKKPMTEKIQKTLIQSYLGEVLVCARVRLKEPNKFIATNPGVKIVESKSGDRVELYKGSYFDKKIFINQRVSTDTAEQGINIFNSIVKNKYLLIEEMDDNPIIWRQKYENTKFINFIACHGVQTSTKPLADFFVQFNPNVKIFENQLKELPPKRNFAEERTQNKPVTIFFGALNRGKDLSEVLPAINKIAAEYGDSVAFKIIARTEVFDWIESKNKIFVGDKKVFDGQYVSYEVYEEALRTSDIALLPLRDNIFNRSKSDLKFIESAGNGAVVLASPTVYANTIKDGETGFIYHDVKEFYNKLKLLINNNSKRYEIADNAYEYVKHNRLLSQHYEERWDWYNELLARLPALNDEVYKRIDLLEREGISAFGGFESMEHIAFEDM